ncbi:hypothetical protein ABIB38_003463 [Massilia sp. UYP11]|uniref:hypothetical protein n=1 Tax=Massilia sp. UYP11 TaxID=1756385 RepID=UPI003D190F3F
MINKGLRLIGEHVDQGTPSPGDGFGAAQAGLVSAAAHAESISMHGEWIGAKNGKLVGGGACVA